MFELLIVVPVKTPSVFLSELKKLPELKDGAETIRLDVEEPTDDHEELKKARKEIGEPDKVEPAKKDLIARLQGRMRSWKPP